MDIEEFTAWSLMPFSSQDPAHAPYTVLTALLSSPR